MAQTLAAPLPAASGRWVRMRNMLTRREWTEFLAMVGFIAFLNIAGWGMIGLAARGHFHLSGTTKVFGFGTGVLAYTLGMRHAFDADHISAIDNTTRKLLADGKRPLSVGFWFSLGHSSVVFVLALLLNFGIKSLNSQVKDDGSTLHTITGVIGTSVSAGFLFIIAAINVVILAGILKIWRDMRAGTFDEAELERQLDNRGLMMRILRPLTRRVDAGWKMYPIGFLFGLGFDTATEVALLVLAGSAVVGGLPIYAILALPILFAAGMSVFDMIDGCFMNFAYDWAFSNPVRKVYYNITITGLSIFVAFFIGAVEASGLISQKLGWNGGVGGWLQGFDINKAGFVVVGVFVVTWVVALAWWRVRNVEARWSAGLASAGE